MFLFSRFRSLLNVETLNSFILEAISSNKNASGFYHQVLIRRIYDKNWCTFRTSRNSSSPPSSRKISQVDGDSSVRFHSAESVNFMVMSTRVWFIFSLTIASSFFM